MSKKTAPPSDATQRAMLDAVGAYLQEMGWSVAVIGGVKITESDQHRFEFSVRFTGTRPKS